MNKKKSKIYNIMLLGTLSIIFISLILPYINVFFFKNTSDYAIKINNQTISQEEFIKKYNLEYIKQKKNTKNKITTNINTNNYLLKIYKKTISNIIQESLLKQYIIKINFKIQDLDIKNYIYSQSKFQTNYCFDINKYHQYLNILQISSNEYIKKIKIYLKIQKFLENIYDTDFILENEKKIILKLFSQIRMVQKSHPIKIKSFHNEKNINSKKIKKYFKNNVNELITKEQFTINYILIHKKNIKNIHKNIQKKNQDNIIYTLLNNKINSPLFKKTIKKNKIKIFYTPWITNKSKKSKNLPSKILKYIIKNKLLFKKNNTSIKKYPTTIKTKKNNLYILWIKKYQKQHIKNILNTEQTQHKYQKTLKNIICKLNSGSQILLNKINLKFKHPKYYFRFNTNNKLTKIIFSQPSPTKRNSVYFSFYQNKKFYIYKFSKILYFKLTPKQKKIIISKFLELHSKAIFNTILKNLYKTAKILYGSSLKQYTIV